MRTIAALAVALTAAGCGIGLPVGDYPHGCAALGFSPQRCAAVIEAARSQLPPAAPPAVAIDVLAPDPYEQVTRTLELVATVRFTFRDGTSRSEVVACGPGGRFSPVCTETPVGE